MIDAAINLAELSGIFGQQISPIYVYSSLGQKVYTQQNRRAIVPISESKPKGGIERPLFYLIIWRYSVWLWYTFSVWDMWELVWLPLLHCIIHLYI